MSSTDQRRDDAANALVQAYIACKIALDVLPDLPAAVRQDAERPLRDFCDAVGPALLERFPELDKTDVQ